MITPDSVIDALGGNVPVASALSVVPATVSGWRARGIPSAYWLTLSRLADERGLREITLEALAEIGAREPAGARP